MPQLDSNAEISVARTAERKVDSIFFEFISC